MKKPFAQVSSASSQEKWEKSIHNLIIINNNRGLKSVDSGHQTSGPLEAICGWSDPA